MIFFLVIPLFYCSDVPRPSFRVILAEVLNEMSKIIVVKYSDKNGIEEFGHDSALLYANYVEKYESFVLDEFNPDYKGCRKVAGMYCWQMVDVYKDLCRANSWFLSELSVACVSILEEVLIKTVQVSLGFCLYHHREQIEMAVRRVVSILKQMNLIVRFSKKNNVYYLNSNLTRMSSMENLAGVYREIDSE